MQVSERVRAWRRNSFGPASEQPYRRRVSDWIRLGVALGLIAFLIWHHDNPSQASKNVTTLINGLPDYLDSFFELVFGLGALWAVGLVVVAALVARRWRLARDLLLAGVGCWVIARVIGQVVVVDHDLAKSLDIVTRWGDGSPSFPAVRVAIIVAVIAVASPYVSRPARYFGRVLMLLMFFSAVYLGAADVDGALAGVLIGFAVAAVVHLAFGSPGGRPTARQVKAALDQLGIAVDHVALRPVQPKRGTVMLATRGDEELMVRVLGRDESDAQFLAKAWRWLAYKDGGPELHLTRREDVEAEAYATLLAERAQVRVPHVEIAGSAGPGTALIVLCGPRGPRLSELPAAQITDDVLLDLWQQVDAMHAAHVAHGRCNLHNVVLAADGPSFVDFDHASGMAPPHRISADVAELLASSALAVGNERAVAAAMDVIGTDAVVDALTLLQPAALSREIRPSGLKEHKEFGEHIAALRAAAATAAGTDEPPLQPLYRVSGTNLMMAIGTLIAVFALLSQVGSPQELWDTFTSADIWWLVVAMIISISTNMATAIALMGTVPIPLPLWRTSELQLSMSFSNLAVPAVGGMAAQIRFLQKQGVDLASAVASGGLLINVGNIVAQSMLLVVAVLLAPAKFTTQKIDVHQLVTLALIVILVIVVAGGLILGVPKLRKMVVPPTKNALVTVWAAVRSPRRVAQLLGGNMLNAILYAAVYMACIAAFGGSINFWTLLALNIFISTIASLIPVPGGNTAVSSVGMSGALVAAGLSTEVAVAAVLMDQLVASFIPAVPGWFATNDLLHHDYL
jgi:undecaprenyl-diphosphatase